MGALGGLVKPMADVAGKAAKAGKIKSVKLKVKMDTKGPAVKQNGTRPAQASGT